MTVVLDAGALIAFERRDRVMIARLIEAQTEEEPLVTSTAAVAQVLRDTGRQVWLVRMLRGVYEAPFDSDTARAVGRLLASTDSSDVVDAAVALLAGPGDELYTSDPVDLLALVDPRLVDVIPI
jgi:hypothetical protein